MSDSLRPQGLQSSRLLCPWDFPGKNTGMGCHFLLQWILSTQGLNRCLLCLMYWQTNCLPLSHQESLIELNLQSLFPLRSGCGFSHSVLSNQLFTTPRTATRQASLSFIISRSLLKLLSIELVKPSNHLIICHPLHLLPSVFPIIRVFFNELALRIR